MCQLTKGAHNYQESETALIQSWSTTMLQFSAGQTVPGTFFVHKHGCKKSTGIIINSAAGCGALAQPVDC
jgi:hypothetical protein